MRIVLTGGAGFIGSNVADALVKQGHQLLVIDDLSSGVASQVPTSARLEQADIRSDAAAKAVTAFRPEVLMHHAAQMDVRKSVENPRFDADVNLGGLLNLLEAARGHGLAKVIFASSGGAMYGEPEIYPAPETHKVAPLSPYGVAKASSELYLESYRQMYGLPYVALRYGNVYGPRQRKDGEAGVVAIFGSRLLEGKACTIYGDGKQTRDYVYVGDVVEANLKALSTSATGGFNVGTAIETDVNALYAMVAKAAKVDAKPVHAPARTGEQARSVLAIAKAKAVLGWEPKMPLAQGIERTVQWIRTGEMPKA